MKMDSKEKQQEEYEKKENAFWKWVKDNKKVLTAVGVGAVAVAGVIKLIYAINSNTVGTSSWFKNAPIERMKEVREEIHKVFRDPNAYIKIREEAQSWLAIFDRHISEKEWGGRTPVGPSVHREHGYNLYKPD